MRFAVSLLVFICLASVIGTVVPQNQPQGAYLDLFGPFWVSLFDLFAIWHVYNSWWFLVIMAFLVVSTTLCLIRQTPGMVRDMRSFREHIRGNSLRNFPHRVETALPLTPDAAVTRVQAFLATQGYATRVRQDGDSRLLAAKKGGSNRLGYIFAHTAIVVICVGGLLDSELPVRLQVWFGGKQPVTENMLVAQVPASGRLSLDNPSFRANQLIPEGSRSSNALVSVDDGVLVQPLPFAMKLNRFLVEYYSTGMPSSFKSEVEVTDPETGETFQRTIEVNEPLRYKGVTVYQSSFDDGGSRLAFDAYSLQGAERRVFPVEGEVGKTMELGLGGADRAAMQVVFSNLRTINVENLAAQEPPQPKQVIDHVASVTGSAVGGRNDDLINVGPSVEYRLTGSDGQSREFVNYMLPMVLEGNAVFLAGVRESSAQSYRYLRIPADQDHSVAEFMALRAALDDPQLRAEAAQRFADGNSGGRLSPELLLRAAQGALETFAQGGFESLVARAPQEERGKIMEFAVPMIQLSLGHLRDLQRERQGQAPVPATGPEAEQAERWLQLSLLALANLPEYPSPVFLQLKQFDHVQASVFQVARTPGKNIVYLGCLFLMLGIFAMFYIHDRRIWVWVRPDGAQSQVLAAMTSQRRTLDFENEFTRFKNAFQGLSS